MPVYKKPANLDVFKRYLDNVDLLLIYCDDSTRRQLKNKLDKLLKKGQRVDIMSYDALLTNLITNKHSSILVPATKEEIDFITKRLTLQTTWLERIAINDPLVLYYGYAIGQIIKEIAISDILQGQSTSYLYVCRELNDSDYTNSVLIGE